MKVYISADMEGITGLVSWSQCSRPDGKSYDYGFARRMISHDVNAAIEGAVSAGAKDIVVKDSHGNSKNLLIEDLVAPTNCSLSLVSGTGGGGADGMMQGLDASFDVAVLVGYHAMAGSLKGVMEHTITGGIHRLWINGVETGEIGLSAGVAGQYGVPIVAVTSDEAGVSEAGHLIPGVRGAVTKRGLGRYSAELLHPSQTWPLITEAVRAGVLARDGIQPVRYSGPTHLAIEFNRSEEADMCQRHPSVSRRDGYTVEGEFDSFEAAHKVVWNLVELSFQGIASQH